jgi:phospholipase C
MSRLALVSIFVLLLAAAGVLLSLNGCGGAGGGGGVSLASTNYDLPHVVIIFQENRTPDNLFQGLCLPPNGSSSSCSSLSPTASQYDIATSGTDSTGATITLGPIDLGTVGTNGNPDNYDLSHAHSAFADMCDLNQSTGACKMDGANLIPTACNAGVTACAPANPQFKYVYPSDVEPYLQMAQQYAFGDHMFQTNQGPSFPAHQFILSGTSAPSTSSNLFVAENLNQASPNAGCIAAPGITVRLIGPEGSETSNAPIYPCFEHPTLADLLDAANISWRYYAPSAGSIWTAPNAIQHMCGPNATPPNATACVGADWTGAAPKVVVGQTQSNAQVLADIAAGQLPQVTWVIPDGHDSDHSYLDDGCGPSWVTSIVNAIGNSPYWPNTTVIIAWDDWGGWYDHVPPPQVLAGSDCTQWGCGYVYGFRVPLVVMSPYVQPGYISHVNHDFGSILKFIETKFNLPSLGYADTNALDDLSDFFSSNQSPLVFQPITPPFNDASCKADTSPPTDPDDD